MPSLFKKISNFKTSFAKKKPAFLQGITIQALTGETVVITDLWKEHTVILKVLRRFGCPLCRYESRLLSNLKPEFDRLNVRLVGIGFEEVGLQEFLDGKYWEWELFLDTERTVHRALGLTKMSIIAGLADLLTAASRAAVSAANKLGISGDFNGDGFQLGGTYVIGAGSAGLLYEYKQTGAAEYPSMKSIFSAAGGDPDLVEDMAPTECLFYQESVMSKTAAPSKATSVRSQTTMMTSKTSQTVNTYSSGTSATDMSSIRFNQSEYSDNDDNSISEYGSFDSISVYS
ncbi:hypothetical protein DSO57_1007961 [Entomophthora muscae]|uniref:Uncharacterized protein n=1 Tax=Entomophthora muscae TaxID=34485 RepID=A0ACC2THX2_9FUNG|nr:hypothetical protein DSO57_1007961 [Entomophthora muscae]